MGCFTCRSEHFLYQVVIYEKSTMISSVFRSMRFYERVTDLLVELDDIHVDDPRNWSTWRK